MTRLDQILAAAQAEETVSAFEAAAINAAVHHASSGLTYQEREWFNGLYGLTTTSTLQTLTAEDDEEMFAFLDVTDPERPFLVDTWR